MAQVKKGVTLLDGSREIGRLLGAVTPQAYMLQYTLVIIIEINFL